MAGVGTARACQRRVQPTNVGAAAGFPQARGLPRLRQAVHGATMAVPQRGRALPGASRTSHCEVGYGSTFDRVPDLELRPGVDPGEALFRDRDLERGQVQPAGQGRLAPEAAVRVGEGPDRGAARRDGQGLRVREGPLRAVLGRGAEGAGRSQQPGDRDHGLHSGEVGRPAVLRQGLPDRARQARRQALCAAGRGDAQERPLRAGQVGLEEQAVRGAGAAGGRRPGAAAAAVRRRGALAEGSEHRAGVGVQPANCSWRCS